MDAVPQLLDSTRLARRIGTCAKVVIRAAMHGRICPDYTAGRVLLFHPYRTEEIRRVLKP